MFLFFFCYTQFFCLPYSAILCQKKNAFRFDLHIFQIYIYCATLEVFLNTILQHCPSYNLKKLNTSHTTLHCVCPLKSNLNAPLLQHRKAQSTREHLNLARVQTFNQFIISRIAHEQLNLQIFSLQIDSTDRRS